MIKIIIDKLNNPVLTVLSLMVWTGMLPVPDPDFSQPQATATAPAEPCPPADAVTPIISMVR